MMAMTRAFAAKRVLHRSSSLEAAVLAIGCRIAVKNVIRAWALQPDLAWPLGSIDRLAGLLPGRTTASVRAVKLPNCPAELVRAPGTSGRNAILYLHGGAFLTCGLNTHRALAARLSAAADALVLNVGYRMLPVCGLADAVEDALAGLSWLRRRGYGAERTVIAGDSAGGYLAFGTALRSLARGVVPAAGLAAISPLIDLDPAQKLAHRNISRCSMFTGAALSAFARSVRRSQCRPNGCDAEPLIDPATADLTGMPPVMIHVGADELLLADSELVAQRLADAHAPCELHIWSGQIHDFPLAADILPEGRQAIRYVGDFVKGVTASSAQSVA
ncbi:esterase [Mycolicibacterium conceptionense]|uniref:Esterase n=2 Tax=Mycolicibacterium conceptionense TaxID=451644 RepID=A0A1A1VRE8_9MYCO|nr:esterase [Mycolicibacterium conceptionense]OBE97333.1 esterase [Mycolicibacterium conceptionense]OBF22379.1 esterase [Mycolicibacterium conceptionense]OBF39961.1 esterase [Mycolicibacterium conceptionense]OBI01303.1 esterase [Mycolicibacterium conceptionense]